MRRAALLLLGLIFASLLGLTSARAYQRPWGLERVSLTDEDSQAEGWSPYSSISADGRFVAFNSTASNLVPGDTNQQEDIFVRDRLHGRTVRANVASDGTQANAQSFAPNISADGRVVTFVSFASNLVPGVNGIHVYVHDLESRTTEVADVSSAEVVGDLYAFSPAISEDGRFVAFESTSTNLVPGDTNSTAASATTDVFVRDRLAGTTERVSVASDGTEANGSSKYPTISADGRFVAFDSEATNLVQVDVNAAQDPLFRRDAFVHDRVNHTTELVSVTSDELQGSGAAMFPVVSATGRYVAFVASASNLVPNDGNRVLDVFVRDRQLGTTERVSVSSSGMEGNNSSLAPSISADGRFVAFGSDASNLVAGDTNGTHDSFIHDRLTGATERLSVTPEGIGPPGQAITPKVTSDGRTVAFGSVAPLLPEDTNANFDVYLIERGPGLGVAQLVATQQDGAVSVEGAITLDGTIASAAADPRGDAPAAPAGIDLTRASVSFRPESEDLAVRWEVASMPTSVRGGIWTQPGVGGAGPGFALIFRYGGTQFLLHGKRVWPDPSAPGPGEHRFLLSRCEPTCVDVGRVAGAVGTTGEATTAAIPLSMLGGDGERLTEIEARISLDAVPVADGVQLPATAPLTAGVAVAVVPSGQQPGSFESVEIANGRFSASLPAGAAGERDVMVRVCRADECVFERVALGG